jgi:hypothetical protein
MPWFERNPIGRPLFPHERQFVAELKQLLSEIGRNTGTIFLTDFQV